MSNMEYCMFENTYNDLHDCYDRLQGHPVDAIEKITAEASEYERVYIQKLINLCIRIADEYGDG